jgi:hypothetical protein
MSLYLYLHAFKVMRVPKQAPCKTAAYELVVGAPQGDVLPLARGVFDPVKLSDVPISSPMKDPEMIESNISLYTTNFSVICSRAWPECLEM